MDTKFEDLQKKIIECTRCPRLVAFRETVKKRASFKNEMYWRKPLPGFGDRKARLFILGLAPSPHGGNRTGRIFTGDPSASFLMKGLHEAGFANQSTSESIEDGLILKNCYITAAVKCVPPIHCPTQKEFLNCSCFLDNELFLLSHVQSVLALGKRAFDAYVSFLKRRGASSHFPTFSHGSMYAFSGWPTLYGCYHPSPQNTYTGLLTPKMFQRVLTQIRKDL